MSKATQTGDWERQPIAVRVFLQLVRAEGESFRQSDCRLLDLAIAVSDDWRQASLQMAPAIRKGDGRRLAGVGSGNAYDRGVVLASFRFVDPLAGGCRGLRLEPAPVISSIMEIVGCPDYIRRWLHV